MGAIKGHQGEFRILEDGNIVDIISITKVSLSMDSDMSRSFYVGKKVGVGDQTVLGWSGSLDMEVLDSKAEDFIDGIISGTLNGIGKKDYAFVVSENYDDGSSVSYMFSDCQFKYSREAGGLNEKITKRLEFQASERTKI